MAAVDAWFARQAKRDQRLATLEDALLRDRYRGYLWHRLRFFAARWAIASGLQLAKVLLLLGLFGSTSFLRVVEVIAVGGVVAGVWWGALEVLRQRVRRMYRLESRERASREIGRWLRGSLAAAGVVGAVTVLWLAASWASLATAPDARAGALHLALAAIALRTGLELPVRAYHAGAYALRRVYRPMPAIALLQVASLALLVLLAPTLGAYAVGLAEVAVGLGYAAVTVRYVGQANRVLGLQPGSHVRRGGSRRKGRRLVPALREITLHALAGGVMTLDAVVLIAIVAAERGRSGGTWAVLLLAAVSPTIRAGFDWSRLVYFDLSRLGTPILRPLRRRLDQVTVRLAALIGLLLAGYAAAVGATVLRLTDVPLAGLAVLLVGASLLGVAQMEAFTAGAYRRVLAGGAVAGAGLALLPAAAHGGADPLLAFGLVTLAATAVVRLLALGDVGRAVTGEPMAPTEWLTVLRLTKTPVRLGGLRVPPQAGDRGRPNAEADSWRSWAARRLARRLAGRVARGGGVTVVAPDRVLWFEPASRARVTAAAAVAMAAGRSLDAWATAGLADGPAALAELRRRDAFGVGEVAGALPVTTQDVAMAYLASVPGGQVWTPGRPAPSNVASLPAADRRGLLWEAVVQVRDLGLSPSRGRLDVTVWCPDGGIGLLLVADPRRDGRERARWRRLLRQANLAAASGGVLTAGPTMSPSARDEDPAALAASAAT